MVGDGGNFSLSYGRGLVSFHPATIRPIPTPTISAPQMKRPSSGKTLASNSSPGTAMIAPIIARMGYPFCSIVLVSGLGHCSGQKLPLGSPEGQSGIIKSATGSGGILCLC
jgi:hypothetical protein